MYSVGNERLLCEISPSYGDTWPFSDFHSTITLSFRGQGVNHALISLLSSSVRSENNYGSSLNYFSHNLWEMFNQLLNASFGKIIHLKIVPKAYLFSGGSGGRCHQRPPPPNRIQFFHFCTHFCQKVPTSEVGAPPTARRPPNGKSWIRHCWYTTNTTSDVIQPSIYSIHILPTRCLRNAYFVALHRTSVNFALWNGRSYGFDIVLINHVNEIILTE